MVRRTSCPLPQQTSLLLILSALALLTLGCSKKAEDPDGVAPARAS